MTATAQRTGRRSASTTSSPKPGRTSPGTAGPSGWRAMGRTSHDTHLLRLRVPRGRFHHRPHFHRHRYRGRPGVLRRQRRRRLGPDPQERLARPQRRADAPGPQPGRVGDVHRALSEQLPETPDRPGGCRQAKHLRQAALGDSERGPRVHHGRPGPATVGLVQRLRPCDPRATVGTHDRSPGRNTHVDERPQAGVRAPWQSPRTRTRRGRTQRARRRQAQPDDCPVPRSDWTRRWLTAGPAVRCAKRSARSPRSTRPATVSGCATAPTRARSSRCAARPGRSSTGPTGTGRRRMTAGTTRYGCSTEATMTDRGPWWDTGRLAENGHPAYYATTELRTLLILEVWIDGEPVTFRDAVETFIWIEQFADPERRESYLTYWIRKQVGMLAADPDRLARLRQKLMVVEPKDQHDYPRCKTSSENAIMFVRCSRETIVRVPLMPFFDGSESLLPPEPTPLRLPVPVPQHA